MSHVVVTRGLLVAVVVVVLLLGIAPSTASAGTDIGQLCVNLFPLVDTIRLSLTATDGSATMIAVSFRWRFGTSAQVAGAGTITDSLLNPGSLDVALNGTHNTPFFGGNKTCSLFAVLSPPAFSGLWQYTCTGASIGSAFTGSGVMNFVPCTPAM